MINQTQAMPKKVIHFQRKATRRVKTSSGPRAEVYMTELLSWWADIMENTPIGAAVVDLKDRTIRSLNLAFAAMHGYSLDELSGRSLLEVLAPEYYRQTNQTIRQAAQKGHIMFETLHLHKDGSTFEVRADVTVMKDNPNSLLYRIIPPGLDRKQNQIENDPARLLKVIDKVEESVMVTNLKGEIVYVNPFFEKISGYLLGEVYGKNPRFLKSRYQHPSIYKNIWDTIIAGGTWRGTFINRRKDGSFFQEEATIFPVRDDTGHVINFAAVKRDVTDHIQRENEMEAISSLSSALRIAYDRDEMFPVVLEQIMNLMKVRAACLAMVDPVTNTIIIEQSTGDFSFDNSLHISILQDLSAGIIKSGQPYYADDIDPHAGSTMRSCIKITLAMAGIPLVAQNETFGVLWVIRHHEINKNEFPLLSLLGNIVAIAISRAKLHNQTLNFAQDLAQAYEATIEGWARALEIRDKETEGHARRVADLTLELARQLGLTNGDLINMRRGALLHDIGKMAIPDNVLLKPGPLNSDEWTIMRRHPIIAKELLGPIAQLQPALDIPYYHHEKFDGSGYPLGLKQNEIPLAARIFTVVDVWDALCSNRPYRAAWPEDMVKTYIRAQTGKQFDPIVVDAFFQVIQDRPHELIAQPQG
jgi:PAS domain S-box-containing protein/putative nucleotidyltransferase with HDIG domain